MTTTTTTAAAHPFIKWAGGKTQLIPHLRDIFPKKVSTYYEPFIGGGAVFFALANEERFARAVINDWNGELVNLYRVIRDFPEEIMTFLREREAEYEAAPRDTYMAWRNPDMTKLGPVEKAGRFILLNKAGFNGLYRVNRSGGFNVPWGQKVKVTTFDEANIRACSSVLERWAEIRQGDFVDACEGALAGDCVYFDPPYVPLTPTSDFTSYTSDKFSLNDQQRLAVLFEQLAERGVHVVLSNSDTPVVRALYAGWEIHVVKARRNINSKGEGRGAVDEVIVVGRRDARTQQDPATTERVLSTAGRDGGLHTQAELVSALGLDEEPNPAGTTTR